MYSGGRAAAHEVAPRRREPASNRAQGGGIDARAARTTTHHAATSTVTGNVARDVGPSGRRRLYASPAHARPCQTSPSPATTAAGGGGHLRPDFGPTDVHEHDRLRQHRRRVRRQAPPAGRLAPQPRHRRQLRVDRPGNLQGARLLGRSPITAARLTLARSPPRARDERRQRLHRDRPARHRPPAGRRVRHRRLRVRRATLTVATAVINGDGGEDRPADLTVHARDGAGGEVGGSPQPGNTAGTAFTLPARAATACPPTGRTCTRSRSAAPARRPATSSSPRTSPSRVPLPRTTVAASRARGRRDPRRRTVRIKKPRRPLPRHAGGRHAAQRHDGRHAEGPHHADRRGQSERQGDEGRLLRRHLQAPSVEGPPAHDHAHADREAPAARRPAMRARRPSARRSVASGATAAASSGPRASTAPQRWSARSGSCRIGAQPR